MTVSPAFTLSRIFTRIFPDRPTGWLCLSYSLYKLNRPLEAFLQLLHNLPIKASLKVHDIILLIFLTSLATFARGAENPEAQRAANYSANVHGLASLAPRDLEAVDGAIRSKDGARRISYGSLVRGLRQLGTASLRAPVTSPGSPRGCDCWSQVGRSRRVPLVWSVDCG